MIEKLMIFALGCLAATLVSLLTIPAINRRAERLARRRLEALFPLSISELTAEKDHLRAEFAVLQRRLERKAEEALASKHRDMEELGRRAVRIHELESELARRSEQIAKLQEELADTLARLASTEEELARTRASLAATRDTLTALENAHRMTLDELASTRVGVDQLSTALAGIRTELATVQESLAAREGALASLEERHAAALNEIDTKRITISDLDTRLGTQTARADELERSLSARNADLAAERQRLSDLVDELTSERDRRTSLEERIRDLEGERDRHIGESEDLKVRLEELSSNSRTLLESLDERDRVVRMRDEALAEARNRIASLEAQHSSGDSPAGHDEIRSENAELRRRISTIADQIIQAADGRSAQEDAMSRGDKPSPAAVEP